MPAKGLTTKLEVVDGGCDQDAVDAVLTDQLARLHSQVDAAAVRIAQLEAELAAATECEDAIRLTMIAATKARDELLATARKQVDEMLDKTRREAFALMKGTRDDAEQSVAAARVQVEAARREADDLLAEARRETDRLLEERKVALERIKRDYEAESNAIIDRINTLRSIADDLTVKSALPPVSPPSAEPTGPTDPQPATNTRTVDPPSAVESSSAPAPESSPAVDVPVPAADDGNTPTTDRPSGSFYSRRSAKLPRLGTEAGRSALAAASAMRTKMHADEDDTEHDDLVVRTA